VNLTEKARQDREDAHARIEARVVAAVVAMLRARGDLAAVDAIEHGAWRNFLPQDPTR
jgi:uncharacterized membrane protein YqjE